MPTPTENHFSKHFEETYPREIQKIEEFIQNTVFHHVKSVSSWIPVYL